MDAAFVLYDQMTALDLIGPYQVLTGNPALTPHFVAASARTVRCDTGLRLEADKSFADLPHPDLIVVPGSGYWRTLDDAALVEWLRGAYPTATWTTSVCTGAVQLAKAGVLTGRVATTHWLARGSLAELGALVSTDRVVVDGDVITSAGVSAGIDMGLTLAGILWGEEMAQTIQLVLEYDPQPPFAAGSPDKAPAEIVAAIRARFG